MVSEDFAVVVESFESFDAVDESLQATANKITGNKKILFFMIRFGLMMNKKLTKKKKAFFYRKQ
jgi:hypothetical protein